MAVYGIGAMYDALSGFAVMKISTHHRHCKSEPRWRVH